MIFQAFRKKIIFVLTFFKNFSFISLRSKRDEAKKGVVFPLSELQTKFSFFLDCSKTGISKEKFLLWKKILLKSEKPNDLDFEKF